MKIFSYVKVDNLREIDGTQYYRQVLPMKAVNDFADGIRVQCTTQGEIDTIHSSQGMDAVELRMLGHDIYAYPRMIHKDIEPFLKAVHAQDAVMVMDADDDLTEDFRLVSGRGAEFKKVLGLVDYVTTSTQPLADHLSQYTKEPPTVLLNHVDVSWMQSVGRRIVYGLTIGFSGSPTHWGDWYLPAVPFARICEEYEVMPLLHGDMPRYLKYVAKHPLEMGGVPYIQYPSALRNFDILLCAVDGSDPFNVGKSSVKALEAMSVGAVAICSRFKPYMDLAEQGAPVVVIEEESRDGWYEAMRGVVTDEDRREWLQEQGPGWVEEHRDISSGYKQWEDFFRKIHTQS